MSIEFRFRRTHYVKEHEFIDRISTLLSAMSAETPQLNRSQNSPTSPSPSQKVSGRASSLIPKITLFQFNLPINVKNPVISAPSLPSEAMPPIKKAKISKSSKPRVPTFIRPKPFKIKAKVEDNMNRYQRILNLTQDLIDKDSLKGWN